MSPGGPNRKLSCACVLRSKVRVQNLTNNARCGPENLINNVRCEHDTLNYESVVYVGRTENNGCELLCHERKRKIHERL